MIIAFTKQGSFAIMGPSNYEDVCSICSWFCSFLEKIFQTNNFKLCQYFFGCRVEKIRNSTCCINFKVDVLFPKTYNFKCDACTGNCKLCKNTIANQPDMLIQERQNILWYTIGSQWNCLKWALQVRLFYLRWRWDINKMTRTS